MTVMTGFERAITPTLANEDLWSDDPDDPGKGTCWGLTRSADATSGVWPIVDRYLKLPGFPESMRHDQALLDATKATYKAKYWDAMGLDTVSSRVIAAKLFDSGVNIGIGTVATYLHLILNSFNKKATLWPDLPISSQVDAATLTCVGRMLNQPRGEEVLYDELNAWQRVYYVIGKDRFKAMVDAIKATPIADWRETFEWGWETNRTPDYLTAKQRAEAA